MFSKRQDGRVYIDRSGVAVDDVIENIMTARSIANTISPGKFPISKEELFAAIDFTLDHKLDVETYPPIIEFDIKLLKDQLDVKTTEISDWVFLSCLAYGNMYQENVSDCNKLYSIGIREVMREILFDLSNDSETFSESLLHKTVYEAVVRNYGEIDRNQAAILLESI